MSDSTARLPAELLAAVFDRAIDGGAPLGTLSLVCRRWGRVASARFHRKLFARLSAAHPGAACGGRLRATVVDEVRSYLRGAWAKDLGVAGEREARERLKCQIWAEEAQREAQPGEQVDHNGGDGAGSEASPGMPRREAVDAEGALAAHEIYRAAVRAHFRGVLHGPVSREDYEAARSVQLAALDADPTSSAEAAGISALLFRLAHLRLRSLLRLSKNSMLFVDGEDRIRLVKQPSGPIAGPPPTLLPFLPRVDASSDPIALFSPAGTRIVFVCAKDVSPDSVMPFPGGRAKEERKKKNVPEWPNFGPDFNKRCLVSCWVDGTDWREMDLTWEGSIHFSFTLAPPPGHEADRPEPYIILTRDSSYGYLILTSYPLSAFPEGGVDLPSRMEGMREIRGGVGVALPDPKSKGEGGFWVSGHEYFPALADARSPLESLVDGAPPRERDRFAPQPGTPAFFRAMLREAMLPGSSSTITSVHDPFGNDGRVLVKGGEVVVVGWVKGDGFYNEEATAATDSESDSDSDSDTASTTSSHDAWLEDPKPAPDKVRPPPRELTPFHSHPYSTSTRQPTLFVSTLPDTAIVARLRRVPDPGPLDAAAMNQIWAAGGDPAAPPQLPAWTLDVIAVDLRHSQRDRERRRKLEALVEDIRQQMHWDALHARAGKGKGKPAGNVRTIGDYAPDTEQLEVDRPLWSADEHIHGMKELWGREPEDDPEMMRDNGNQTMLIAPTDPAEGSSVQKDGYVTLQAAASADEETGYLDMLKEAAGDLYEGRKPARVLCRLPLPSALLTWMRDEPDGDDDGWRVEDLGMPVPPPPRPGQAQAGFGGAANVATLATAAANPAQQQPPQRGNPAEMQHLLRNAVFYLDPSGSGLAALTRRGGADSARTVWIVDLGRRYEGRRGSVWDPFGVADYEEGAEEDEFGRERNERIETVEQLWGTTLATYVFDRPVRSFTWISGARFVVVTGDRPVRPAGTLPTAGSNVGGRTLNEATAWDEPAAGSRKFSREDLLSTWHLLQVTRKEHDRPPRAWETAAPEPGAANRISPRTTLAVEQVGTSRRLHLPQLVMPDGVMPLADAGGIAHLDPANISTSGNLFANVLSTAQARMIATVLEPETVPAQPQPSFAARFGRGIMKLAVKAADAYWGTKLEEALDQEPEQERVKSLVRIARVVSAEGDEADWESVDLPGKFARFSPI